MFFGTKGSFKPGFQDHVTDAIHGFRMIQPKVLRREFKAKCRDVDELKRKCRDLEIFDCNEGII